MGMLGDILYPNNKTMAEDLNKKYQQLLDNNTLQNNLTNSYHALASSISRFDAYLMALICMHYVIVYDDEKLANLPETDIPKLSQSIADRIEVLALEGIAAVQVLQSLNAMRKGVVNLYRNAGTYKAKIQQGYKEFKLAMQRGVNMTRLKMNSATSANVSSLTEENPATFEDMSYEITEIRPQILNSEEVESLNADQNLPAEEEFELVDVEVTEVANVAIEGAEIAERSVANAASAFVEGASAIAEGLAAILGPAVVMLIVVTEIIGAVEAGEMNEKLQKAEVEMDSNLKKQEAAIGTLKKAFGNLLDSAIVDIKEYNELIKEIIGLNPSRREFFASYRGYHEGDGFDYRGLKGYKDNLTNVKDAQAIAILQADADSDLKDVIACITAQSIQDSTNTKIITNIKSWLKKHEMLDINQQYIDEAVDIFGVDEKRIISCNKLRIAMNIIAVKLQPYHQAIQEMRQHPGTSTKQPDQDVINHQAEYNPNYSPDPNDFVLSA